MFRRSFPDPVDLPHVPVASLDESKQDDFLWTVYLYLVGAILVLTGVEAVLFLTNVATSFTLELTAVTNSGVLLFWGVVGSILVGLLSVTIPYFISSQKLNSALSVGIFTVQAVFCIPLLYVSHYWIGGDLIESIGYVTLMGCAAILATIYYGNALFDLSGRITAWSGYVGLIFVVTGMLFGLQAGSVGSVGFVAFSGFAILYRTPTILHYYPEDCSVGAALGLFGSIALASLAGYLFFIVLYNFFLMFQALF